MKRKLVFYIKLQKTCVIEIALYILCVSNLEERVLPVKILLGFSKMRYGVQHVASYFKICSKCLILRVVRYAYARLQNKQILIVVLEDSVAISGVVKIIALECG